MDIKDTPKNLINTVMDVMHDSKDLHQQELERRHGFEQQTQEEQPVEKQEITNEQ